MKQVRTLFEYKSYMMDIDDMFEDQRERERGDEYEDR